ncbi:hypothetical protein [Salipiger mucosus]|uniref:Uncharacterized protein n=1 Tax=Salipiger mucosus DSM 16094 TaxID=1123237 RepID=S9Q9T0_9RHOB|nr:hypothetical protein [Salipiger mucosus]EPX78096.1 hypothetical protein Salmuc_03433 [Salipiger mucosus DSM 16094]
MQYTIEYDNEVDGEHVDLEGADLSLLGTDPHSIETGAAEGPVAYYEFPGDTEEADIEAALDKSDWCFKSMTRLDGAPAP